MPKRRTAEDALKMTSNVKQFIAHGRPSARDGNAALDKQSEDADSEKANDDSQGDEATDAQPRPKPSRTRKSQRSRPQPAQDEFARTYAKATVQKTVRYQPKLIAEWEAYLRRLEETGQPSKPFQQVQNEALDLWLWKYARAE